MIGYLDTSSYTDFKEFVSSASSKIFSMISDGYSVILWGNPRTGKTSIINDIVLKLLIGHTPYKTVNSTELSNDTKYLINFKLNNHNGIIADDFYLSEFRELDTYLTTADSLLRSNLISLTAVQLGYNDFPRCLGSKFKLLGGKLCVVKISTEYDTDANITYKYECT